MELVVTKPAKFFTRVERGRCKSKYSRRKKVWDLISILLRTGHCQTSREACELIRSIYGQSSSVTTIIRKIVADQKAGTVPEALVDAMG